MIILYAEHVYICIKKEPIIADELLCPQGDVFRTTFPETGENTVQKEY